MDVDFNHDLDPKLMLDMVRLCKHLELLGCRRVSVGFSGSGDSGAIDNVVFLPEFDGSEEEESDLEEGIRDFTYKVIGSHGYDYANNGGGAGVFTLDVEHWAWSMDFTYHLESYDDECDEHGEYISEEDPQPTTGSEMNEAALVRLLRDGDFETRSEALKLISTLLPEMKARAAAGAPVAKGPTM